jgi:NitT/TauT family transport system permease protein
MKLNKASKQILFFLFLLFLWWLVYKLRIWPVWLFPSPLNVFNTLVKGFASKKFLVGIAISMKRIFLGFGISLLLGTALGFVIAKIKWLREATEPFILGLQTLPSICCLPLALLWFGLNETAIIFVVIMGTILSITISVKGAVMNVTPALLNVGRMLGAKGIDLYKQVIFPAILPSYVTGIKHGWSFAWRSLMSGEMLFISAGLGQLLMMGRELNDMSQVMAVMIVIILIGVLFEQFVFGNIERGLRRKWGV